jgi:threonine dehydrogenase-like Zn-dependent dehydrogenase
MAKERVVMNTETYQRQLADLEQRFGGRVCVGGRPSTLLRLVSSHQLDAGRFVTHHFTLDQFEEAYDVFSRAAETGALKVVLTRT